MPIVFALPDLIENASPPETRPARLRAWLSSLAEDSPVATARTMLEALFGLNRAQLPFKARLEIAEVFSERARSLWVALDPMLRGASHPLTGAALDAAKVAIDLAAEVNVAWKRCLTDAIERKGWAASPRQLPALVHRCQLAAGRVLSTCYTAYAPVPEGTWHDLHAIYLLAVERGLARGDGGPHPTLTPERAYVQTLLLALANPYGLLPGQIGQVMEFIGEHAQTALLTPESPVHRSAKAVAIVPTRYDFPPFAANKGGSTDGDPLYLLTFDLAFRLQESLLAVERGGPVPESVGRGEHARQGYVALLRRLLREWGDPPARHFNRLPTSSEVQACFGFAPVWQVTRARRSDQPLGVQESALLATARIANQTPGGFALRLSGQAGAALALRVGELVGLRVRPQERWLIGAVRWFRNSLRDGGIELGCEVLTQDAALAIVQREGESDAAGMMALHAPADAGGQSAPTVLVPAGALESEAALILRRDRHRGTIVLTKLIEHAPGFDRFEYIAVP
jgi:hypothetical protein